jgi:hypothetical protein
MHLKDIVTLAFNGFAAKLRRNAIAYAVCAVSSLAIVLLVTSAGVLALEPRVGAVYARLIPAGVFALVIASIVVWLYRARAARPNMTSMMNAHAEIPRRQAQFAQIAMIVEAVLLGYSLSRRSDRR